MQLAIGPSTTSLVTTALSSTIAQCAGGWSRELSHPPVIASMSVSPSAGALCRSGRLKKGEVGAERGVSDPASCASGSVRARRAGSLTPRVCVQILRTKAA
jgi:hypothetical protein